MTPTREEVAAMFEECCEHAHYRGDDAYLRPLLKSIIARIKAQEWSLPEVGPYLAVVYFAVIEFDSKWWHSAATRAFVWAVRTFAYRGRPMWNDFHMCLWKLSRDPRYIGKLYDHLKRGYPIQKSTGEWMIGSVCQQDAEFREHWTDLLKERGPIFQGDLMRLIQEGR